MPIYLTKNIINVKMTIIIIKTRNATFATATKATVATQVSQDPRTVLFAYSPLEKITNGGSDNSC